MFIIISYNEGRRKKIIFLRLPLPEKGGEKVKGYNDSQYSGIGKIELVLNSNGEDYSDP